MHPQGQQVAPATLGFDLWLLLDPHQNPCHLGSLMYAHDFGAVNKIKFSLTLGYEQSQYRVSIYYKFTSKYTPRA